MAENAELAGELARLKANGIQRQFTGTDTAETTLKKQNEQLKKQVEALQRVSQTEN